MEKTTQTGVQGPADKVHLGAAQGEEEDEAQRAVGAEVEVVVLGPAEGLRAMICRIDWTL